MLPNKVEYGLKLVFELRKLTKFSNYNTWMNEQDESKCKKQVQCLGQYQFLR